MIETCTERLKVHICEQEQKKKMNADALMLPNMATHFTVLLFSTNTAAKKKANNAINCQCMQQMEATVEFRNVWNKRTKPG